MTFETYLLYLAAVGVFFASPPGTSQLLILGGTYLVVDGVILVLWGLFGIRAAAILKQNSLVLVNKICGLLMIAAAALLATKDFQPQR